MKVKQFFASALSVGAVLLIIGGIFFLGSDMITTTPDYAIVFLDTQAQVYYSPLCSPQGFSKEEFRKLRSEIGGERVWRLVLTQYPQQFKQSTAGQAKNTSYKPEHDCREKGAFAETGSLPIHLLRNIGLWPKKSRWNHDGTWNFDNSLW